MTTVRICAFEDFSQDKQDNAERIASQSLIMGFEAKGHSGFAPEGEDIVCAAISAVTQTCLLGLLQYARIEPSVEQKDGYLRVCASHDDASNPDVQAIFHTMAYGLESIRLSCPDFLKITFRRCKHKCSR